METILSRHWHHLPESGVVDLLETNLFGKEMASLRDCLEVILNWAADMPQLPGAGPGKSPASVSKFFSDK